MSNTVLNKYRRTAFNLVNTGKALNPTISNLLTQVLARVNALDAKFIAHSELRGSVTPSIYTSRLASLGTSLTTIQTYFTSALANLPTNLSVATSHLQDQIAYGILPIGKVPDTTDIQPYFGSIMGSGVTALSTVSDSLDHIDAVLSSSEGLTSDNLMTITTSMATIETTVSALNASTQAEATLLVQAVADLTNMAATAGLLNAWNNPWGPFVINAVGSTDLLAALNGNA